jgi:hypothetical protein
MFPVEGDRLVSAEMDRKRIEALKRNLAFSEAGKKGAEVRYGSHPTSQANGKAIAGSKEVTKERKDSAENHLPNKENGRERVRKIIEQLAGEKRMPAAK